MKAFGTHLPVMPTGEIIVLLGQTQRRLGETGWAVTSDLARAAVGLTPLEIRATRDFGQRVSLTCAALPFHTGEYELRATFDEGGPNSAEIEQIIGATMSQIHNVLCMLMGDPPGQPPAPNMWLLTGTPWQHAVYFSG